MTFKVIYKLLSQWKSKLKNFTCNLTGLKYSLKGSLKAVTTMLWLISQLCLVGYLYPATPAGTIISNKVIASYKSSPVSTFTNRVTSNTDVHTVTNLSMLIITPTNNGTVQEGNSITFAHIVSNYGNSTNRIQLISTSSKGYPLTNYFDTNSNGILDAGEPIITNNFIIPPNQKVYFIVKETVPINFTTTVYTDTITVTGIPKIITNLSVNGTYDYSQILPVSNRITYIFATDGVHNATKLDGTENLGDNDVTVYIKLLYPPFSGKADMYYDVNKQPDGSTNINTTDTKVELHIENDKWVGVIPGDDSRITDNATVQFVFEIDGKLFYQTVTPSTQAYRYIVKTYQYKETSNLFPNICYPLDDSKPKPTLLFKLDTDGNVKVEVYDLKGDKVRTLVDEYRNAGTQPPVKWDGKNDSGEIVGTGLYFVVLQYNDKKEVFKVIVVK